MSMVISRSPHAAFWTRKLVTGVTVIKEQVVCMDANKYGILGAPASVNDYTEAVGVTTEAKTYSATQGSSGADCLVEVVCDPWAIYKGQCSGGTTVNTAFAETTDGNLLTNTSASSGGTVITDADVGTSDFVYGYAVGLSGANKGHARVITSHSDNTSETVTMAFDSAIAVGDTFVRTFGVGNQGLELTTNFAQFNMKPGAGVNLPDTGHASVYEVLVDGNPVSQSLYLNIRNATAPVVEVEFFFIDHVWGSVA